jgi:sialidase-1
MQTDWRGFVMAKPMNRIQFVAVCLAVWLGIAGLLPADDIDRSRPVPLAAEMRQRCVDILRAGLKSDEFWPSMHAAEALTIAGHGGDVIAALRDRVATEPDHQHRCGLARELVRAGDRTFLPVLFDTLRDEKSNGRIHAAESLYKVAEIGDGRLMRDTLWSKDNRLRLMSAAALGRCGNESALGALRSFLKHEDRELRKIAAWVLGLLGDLRDLEIIHTQQQAEDDPVARTYFTNALACLGFSAGREELGRNLGSADSSIRTYSAEFAGYSRCVEHREKLIKLLDDATLDVRVRAAQSLVALSLPPRALGLPIAVTSEDISVDVYQATPEHPRYSEGSIIALRDNSLLYAVTEFGGNGADHANAAIVGKSSSDGGRTWGLSRVLQPNVGRQNVMSVTLRRLPSPASQQTSPQLPKGGQGGVRASEAPNDSSPLGMFYLVKNSPTDLKVYLRISRDEAKSFGDPILVTNASGYHVMNNDRVTVLSSGRLVCPVSWCEDVSKGAGHFVSSCHLSDDGGQTWRVGTGKVDQPKRGAMEPEVIELIDLLTSKPDGLLMIVRTQLGIIATSTSTDGGDRWSESRRLPVSAPEAPATIRRVPATGDLLLVWNNTFQSGAGHGGKRTPLTAAISTDEGQTWSRVRNVETSSDQGFAYTSVLFHKDRVLLSYYVSDDKTGKISSRFRSLPARWFYETP